MFTDIELKIAIYQHIARTTNPPTIQEMANHLAVSTSEIRAGYARLYQSRVLVLEPDGETIRMAPPFSGVPTQHRVVIGEKSYMANCAWDSLGVIAALHADGIVHSRCEQTLAPLTITVNQDGPSPVPCIIHFAVPASQWWRDIVYT